MKTILTKDGTKIIISLYYLTVKAFKAIFKYFLFFKVNNILKIRRCPYRKLLGHLRGSKRIHIKKRGLFVSLLYIPFKLSLHPLKGIVD